MEPVALQTKMHCNVNNLYLPIRVPSQEINYTFSNTRLNELQEIDFDEDLIKERQKEVDYIEK